jgi:YidC/Oxa1 family membrane protein insertase
MVTTGGVFIAIGGAIVAVQIVSAKLPQWLSQKRQGVRHLDEQTKAAMKKQNKTSTIMVVVFVIMGLTVPTLLGIYWMYSGLFTITQNLIQHWIAQRNARLAGITKQEKAWKVKMKQTKEAFVNAEIWDTPIIPGK